MKYLKPYRVFESSIRYSTSPNVASIPNKIINDFKNSDIDDILLPLIDDNLHFIISPVNMLYSYEDGFSPRKDYVGISILTDDKKKGINYLKIKDDVDFLIRYINNMGYQTCIYAYDKLHYMFRNISFAENNIVDQIGIYVTEK